MKKNLLVFCCVAPSLLVAQAVWADAEGSQTLEERYPGILAGILQSARLSALPDGELLRIGDTPVLLADFEKTLEAEGEAPGDDSLFRLEEFVMIRLVRREMDIADDQDMDNAAIRRMFGDYFDKITRDVSVSEEEMRAFYEEVKDRIDAGYDEVKSDLQQYMMENKKREQFAVHFETVVQRTPIRISEPWADAQVKRLRDNVVDKARAAGVPLLAAFSAEWCPPCQLMKPIIARIKERFADKLTVLVVDVDKNGTLAQLYRAESIPLLLFFDKDGKEVHRQQGGLSEEELVSRLRAIGVS